MHFDILSLGPARMDLFVNLPEEEVSEVCSLDQKRCMIELGFGEKIAVRGMTFAVGGNTGNNAVGLARLGYKAAMVGTMGSEWSDRQALDVLKKEGIDTGFVKIDQGSFGFGVVINYQGERTILSYYPRSINSFPIDTNLEADWMYLTTAGENFEDFYHQAVAWAKTHHTKIGFNPGTRQLKVGRESLKFALESTEVLFVNREEAAKLLDLPVDDIKKLLLELFHLGPKVAVITDGPSGTYCFSGSKYLYMPIVPAPVVERTGAGDAFGSGFLAGYMKGKPLEECLKMGTVNSASVLGFIGPQAGLLTPDQMQAWLEKTKEINPIDISTQ